VSRRTRAILALALFAAIVFGGVWLWRGYVAEQARITARDAARLAAIERSIARIVEHARADSLLPGISAAVALPDGRVAVAVAGVSDLDGDVPMTRDTRFLSGSTGKSFHAALAVSLAREGVLDLDAPIARWIGGEKWFARLPNARALTLRHLLQHQSGLSDHLYSLEFVASEVKLRLFEPDEAVIPPERLIEGAFDRKPLFQPGEGFAYSDTNYVLAGIVIAHATGRSSFDQVEERFLAPLGLTGIVAARTRRIPQLAAGYQLPVNPFLLPVKMVDERGVRVHPMLESTGGGFAATPSDLVRWLKALFEGRAAADGVVDEMTRHTVPTPDARRYGLGLYRYETPLGPAWGHGGYFPGYRSAMIYFPETKIAVAAQTNRDFGVDLDALMLEIAQRIQRELQR
jgi:D-alanyl-D-alanine carboxypeptidase